MCNRTTPASAADSGDSRVTVSADSSAHPSGRPFRVTWTVAFNGGSTAGMTALNDVVAQASASTGM